MLLSKFTDEQQTTNMISINSHKSIAVNKKFNENSKCLNLKLKYLPAGDPGPSA